MDETRAGHLATHIMAFGYLLREMGLPVSPGQMLDLLGALVHVPVTSREDFRAAMRCMLVLRREDLPLFDEGADSARALAGRGAPHPSW